MPSPEQRVRHFQDELEQLKGRLLELGGLAEEAVRLAVKGLVDRDRDLIARVLSGDGPLNALHIEVDNRCFTLLALYQPMAVDLRAIVAAVKINTDLERVGDLAITPKISLVAVCCSKASVSSLNSRTFSMAMTAWSAKVSSSLICAGEKGCTSVRRAFSEPMNSPC